MTVIDLLILAGGHGERLGGRDKAALEVAGRSLLDRVLEARQLLGGAVVVVGDTPVPEGVRRTLEDPPDGGPVAGIAAGLAALAADGGASSAPAEWVAVVAVDQPAAAPAVSALRLVLDELRGRTDAEATGEVARIDDVTAIDDVDALSHVDPTGHRQWLLALYRRTALEAAVDALPDPRHTSVRRLVGGLRWLEVERGARHVGDVDTPEDLATWEARLENPAVHDATLGRPETEG
ncbi:molybdenum cofactor guanylyltransferase [Ornithinimicrobium tianjinense]|uniref:Molybdenum cofactor guanylyltransferase n=1 Tax=Ornithinimicrobium tianjinense TaxID=1195761 RepID=A0A917BYH8_9MICO|nr:NTP transferase domain-containing protein [Ornithinimicrobium tianjinense]GGF60408.1 molybdenum cofactor guanylyltransferase [Ornithinimicrobium tianjinense]